MIFMLGFSVMELELTTDWLMDFSPGIHKTEAGFASKQGVFHSLCKPARESTSSVNWDIEQNHLDYQS